jgi:hypothetical protein
LELGLRQGGVESPALFILYTADALRTLEYSGRGLPLDKDGNVCVEFFADDMLVKGPTREDLQLSLDYLADYADTWHLQFNGPKSMVIPLHRPADPNSTWNLGMIPEDERRIKIKEVNVTPFISECRYRTLATTYTKCIVIKCWRKYENAEPCYVC